MVTGNLATRTEIGTRIQGYLKLRNLSRKQLASALNVSQAAVSQWILGQKRPSIHNLVLMTQLFDCKMEDLIKKED